MKKKLIIILRVLAVLLFIGVIAAYICIPHSHMPDGIRAFLHALKRMTDDGNPPVILLVFWLALLVAELPFALEEKNTNNVFADEYGRDEISEKPATRKKAEMKPAAVKKAPAKPAAKKPAAKQTAGEKPKPVSRKAPERKPTADRQAKTQVTKQVTARKPTKAPAKAPVKAASKSAAPQRKPASRPASSPAANVKPVRPKTPAYTADYVKPLDDESFDQFLNDLKQDYLNN